MTEPSAESGVHTRDVAGLADSDPRHGPRWYAVHTLPHREFGARMQLAAQSYTIFLPHHLKTVRHARKLRTSDAPFFPRYLFVRLDLARDRWRAINGTYGVVGIIMGRDRPLPVPVGIVEALQARFDPSRPREEDLRVGQRVEVMVGPFASLVGELVRIDGDARVLLQLMGTPIPVSLARDAIVARG